MNKRRLLTLILIAFSLFMLVGCGTKPVIEFWNGYANAVNDHDLDAVAKKFATKDNLIEEFKKANSDYFSKISSIDTVSTEIVTECNFSSSLYINNYYELKVKANVNGEALEFEAYIREDNSGMFFCSNFDFDAEVPGNQPDELWLKSAYYTNSDYQYKFDQTLTSCTYVQSMKNAKNVVIPAEINGIPVTTIYNYAFYKCNKILSFTISNGKLQTVLIPDTITSINDYAFYQCKKLKSVDIPASVANIGSMAFTGCKRLSSVTLNTLSAEIEDAHTERTSNSGSEFEIKGGHDLVVGEIITLSSDLNSVVWSIAGSSTIATIDSDTGEIKALGEGSFTVNAIGVNSDKKKVSASITMSIVPCPQVIKINYDAFDRLKNLKTLTIYAENPNSIYIANGSNLHLSKSVKIYVPYESVDMYKNCPAWQQFADQIFEIQ